ncbi:MAG: phospholipase D family nuclease, partial [Burkholderiaceae bacterium]
MKTIIFALAFLLISSPGIAKTKKPTLRDEAEQTVHSYTDKAPASEATEVAFSPEAGSEALVVKVINASQKSIRLAAYSFTSPAVVRALLNAKKRGVDIKVVVDDRGNRAKKSLAALNLLVNAGIPTRTISNYAIHHDKYIVSDDRHVQTGSFNYSQAAAISNSENVLVLWNKPDIAASYLQHWQNRYDQGVDFTST